MEYPKIQTVFMRDEKGIIIPTQFTKSEFEWLKDCHFRAEEKIDGTNIRVELYFDEEGYCHTSFAGRAEQSIIPSYLMEKLAELFGGANFIEVFNHPKNTFITLYGEGYGHKIKECGDRYRKDICDFALFDVKVGNWWLLRENVVDIANKLGINYVPQLGYMTLMEAIKFVYDGFKSTIAEDPTLDAEGLVLKTPDNLLFRDGERIVMKVKSRDFRQFLSKYGEDSLVFTETDGKLVLATTVEQKIDPRYEVSQT